jgi:hypothetical protein
MRVVGKVAIGIVSIALVTTAAFPWMLYFEGLHNIDGRPTPSAHAFNADDAAILQRYFHEPVTPIFHRLSPWSYFLAFLQPHPPEFSGMNVVWTVARNYNQAHLKDRDAMMWHISGAALTIWISRNWTQEQILTTAAEIVNARKDK